jgi:arylsulfatase A-like enzyme
MPNNLFYMRQYYSQVSMIDDGVGKVIAKLEEKGVLGDTLVIYTADHGLSNGQHGFWGHGEDTWPSNMHRSANNIPLIISHPDFKEPGRQVENLVGTSDIFATVLDIAGCKLDSPENVSGISLSPLLHAEEGDFRDEIFMEQEETRAMRTSQWLFMMRIENTEYDFKHELYDLVADPDERVNLAQDPKYAEVVAKLSARLNEFFSDYTNPRWDLWQGGTVKSNSTRPFLWNEVWGDDWAPKY